MKNSEHLLGSRRFLPMFLTQFFGALNDNVYKQALLLRYHVWMDSTTNSKY